jgi:hypothetical protein
LSPAFIAALRSFCNLLFTPVSLRDADCPIHIREADFSDHSTIPVGQSKAVSSRQLITLRGPVEDQKDESDKLHDTTLGSRIFKETT